MLSEEPAVANAVYIGYASPNSLVYNNEEYIEQMGEEAMEILYGMDASELNASYPYSPYYRAYTDDIQAYVNEPSAACGRWPRGGKAQDSLRDAWHYRGCRVPWLLS